MCFLVLGVACDTIYYDSLDTKEEGVFSGDPSCTSAGVCSEPDQGTGKEDGTSPSPNDPEIKRGFVIFGDMQAQCTVVGCPPEHQRDLFRVDFDTEEGVLSTKQLTFTSDNLPRGLDAKNLPEDERFLTVSADQKWVYYRSGISGADSIYRVPADGSFADKIAPERLTPEGRTVRFRSLSEDQSHIYYSFKDDDTFAVFRSPVSRPDAYRRISPPESAGLRISSFVILPGEKKALVNTTKSEHFFGASVRRSDHIESLFRQGTEFTFSRSAGWVYLSRLGVYRRWF